MKIQIEIELPDSSAEQIIAAFAEANGWTETIRNEDAVMVPNPETPLAFSKRTLVQGAKAQVATYLRTKSINEAVQKTDEMISQVFNGASVS